MNTDVSLPTQDNRQAMKTWVGNGCLLMKGNQ